MSSGQREIEAFKGGMEAAGSVMMAQAFRGLFAGIAQARNDAARRAWAAAPAQAARLAHQMTTAAMEEAAVEQAQARSKSAQARLRLLRLQQAA
jgi:hypothetical protein